MKKNILIIILTFFSVILCIFFIQETYAKYLTSTTEETLLKIARWRILVNNNDIRDNKTANATITPVFDKNDNIAENIIAPTSTGYFDLIIDGSEADVSFTYQIEINPNEDSPVKDLVAEAYSINSGEKIYLTEENKIITQNIMQTDSSKTATIRVYIKWEDGENATMNNEEDTGATKSTTPAKLDIKLKFTQLA